MSEPRNIHWTRDPELLEQFVMHRVDKTRRTKLEAHLLQCEECQLAVWNEQRLVLGIKRVGRDELKARLKERLAATQAEPVKVSIPWVQIASAAAVIVLVAGLGIYNRWYPFVNEQPEAAEQTQPAGDGARSTGGPETDERTASEAKKLSEVQPLITMQQRRELKREVESLAHRGPELLRDAAKETQPQQTVTMTAPATREATGAIRKDAAELDDVMNEEDLKASIFPKRIWVDGTVLQEHPVDMEKRAQPMEMRQKADEIRMKSQLEEAVKYTGVTVTELPLEELPTPQRVRQQQLEGQTVQTLIEQYEGGIHFILYRGDPRQKGKSQQTILQQVREDSVILRVGSERIGYRLPADWDKTADQQKR
ncbi:MAG: hypothetical protein ACRDGA_06635 [Bacteroidota bacterium]